ncbi:MAG: GH3 auxin-responsive promoter family protein [Dehalococcoidales bacterium]
MPKAIELLREGKTEELWQKCCGFTDLRMDEFMTIQQRLLLEQLELLKGCELGRRLLRRASPRNIKEFQEQVPLTTYENYAPYLLERREDALPEKPIAWQRTSGRSGEYPCKWVPLSKRMYRELGDSMLAVMIFCTCKGRGNIALREHDKVIYALAPRPYTSGVWALRAEEVFPFDFLPPLVEAEKMSFQERVEKGFKLALSEGLDMFFGLSSVLVAVGRQFGQGAGTKNIPSLLTKPKILLKLVKALVKSKLARRPMLPKDIWPLKGVVAMGTDSSIYREQVKKMWGCTPLDVYGFTESNIIAMQTWDFRGMTFVPHVNLLEFIPEREYLKWKADRYYQPEILLLDEVKAGENYVIVVTNFLGGPFVRYVCGDMVRITSLRNEELNIDIPQMVFESRIDDIIDLAGFTRLTEKTIWQAIEETGLDYQDWTIRKEAREKPVLHLYLELRDRNSLNKAQVTAAVDEQLRKLDKDYASLEDMLKLHPLEVTLLPSGSFREYMLRQQQAGADLAHLKLPHMNPSDRMLNILLKRAPAPTPAAPPTEKVAIR